MVQKYNLTDQTFGQLTVLKQVDIIHKKYKKGWLCKCVCGNTKICQTYELLKGTNKSCGQCSNNKYQIIDNYVELVSSNGLKFNVDLVDLPRVIQHTWRVQKKTKRVIATIDKQTVFLHTFLMNTPIGSVVDHIDGNPSNNRRYNLRICTSQNNSCNQTIHINNTSGVTGVWFDRQKNKWCAEITVQRKRKELKRFNKFIDAVLYRLYLEEKYFLQYRCTRNDTYLNELLNKYAYNLKEVLEDIKERIKDETN